MSDVRGFDISHWNGAFDFTLAKIQGYKFAFAKATEGKKFIDKQFKRNWVQGPKHEIPLGAYHFFRPKIDALEQAEHFLKTVGPLRDGDLPPVLDLEVTDGVTNSKIVESALLWLRTVSDRLGVTPILYTSPSFAKERGGLAELSWCHLWIAHYTHGAPTIPEAWGKHTFWQYTKVGGLDKNLFNGSLDELKAMTKQAQIGTMS